ncbi:MAG: hypothetical protein M3O34_00965 [Chloroflexota bacterium]|nr:hypothetical protein [Chloroflexota bacterium]
MATDTREELRRVIDELPDDQLSAVLAFARLVRTGSVSVHVSASTTTVEDETPVQWFAEEDLAADAMLRVLAAAPEDDEPLSEEEAASIEEGLAEYQRGDFVDSSLAKRSHLR